MLTAPFMPRLVLPVLRACAALGTACLLYLLLAPRLPDGTQGIPDWLAHTMAFAAILWAFWIWAPRVSLLVLSLVVLALGAAVELIQPLTGRSASWTDLGADLIGILLCAAALVLWRRAQGSRG